MSNNVIPNIFLTKAGESRPLPGRIRLPKLNNLMTIDYSYHIQTVDRFATLDLESNYSAISAVADAC